MKENQNYEICRKLLQAEFFDFRLESPLHEAFKIAFCVKSGLLHRCDDQGNASWHPAQESLTKGDAQEYNMGLPHTRGPLWH